MRVEENVTGGETRARRRSFYRGCAAAVLCAAAVAAGCGDDSGDAVGTTGTSGTGAGGTGGEGGRGASAGCLDPALYADVLSIADPALCAVAVYTADVELGYTVSPTWGRQGGPLLSLPASDGGIEIRRLTPPAGVTGALSAASTTVDADAPADAFVGAQALDLPFFDWTAVSWAGPYPDTQGEVILLEGSLIAARYPVNAFFSGAGIAARGAARGGRLLYTGLSALEDAASSVNALYAADSCGSPGQGARLLPDGDPSCTPPAMIAAWGDFSGPLAADLDGNAFVVLPSFAGDQEARGFAAEAIARDAPPTEGAPLFTFLGSGSSLAALAPAADAPGLLAFQPTDPSTLAPLDPVAVRYAVGGGAVQAEGAPVPLIALATPETLVVLLSDADGRLWIGAPSPGGGTTFVVLGRP